MFRLVRAAHRTHSRSLLSSRISGCQVWCGNQKTGCCTILLPFNYQSYHTRASRNDVLFPTEQHAILSAAVPYVSQSGFTNESLILGAKAAGYSPASVGLFTRGAYDLVLYYLVTQRLALQGLIQNDEPSSATSSSGSARPFKYLIQARLAANSAVASKLVEAFGLMSLPSNIAPSLAELGRLSDDIHHLAGDTSVDSTWYTKRASLAAVYASTEAFMSQDRSKDFKDTYQFLDRRLDDAMHFGRTASNIFQWAGFAGHSSVNVLRSWGVRV